MNIVRANPEQLFEYGPFTVRRQRPGEALSPLVSVDLMSLKLDARIPMQQHQDEEVFTYLWRGSMQHQDSNGERTQLSAKRVMVVNAGDGVQYEESVPLYEAELLQAVIRPALRGGEAMTQVLERDQGIMTNGWTELAGPEESDAPLENCARKSTSSTHCLSATIRWTCRRCRALSLILPCLKGLFASAICD